MSRRSFPVPVTLVLLVLACQSAIARRGSGTVSWMTQFEQDLVGFNVVLLDAKGNFVPLNSVPIRCEACLTCEARSYAYIIPKHKSGRDLYIEVVHLDGLVTRHPVSRAD